MRKGHVRLSVHFRSTLGFSFSGCMWTAALPQNILQLLWYFFDLSVSISDMPFCSLISDIYALALKNYHIRYTSNDPWNSGVHLRSDFNSPPITAWQRKLGDFIELISHVFAMFSPLTTLFIEVHVRKKIHGEILESKISERVTIGHPVWLHFTAVLREESTGRTRSCFKINWCSWVLHW